MHELVDFQRDFSAALRAPDMAEPAALAIHRNSGTRAALDAMAANYPVIRALFGEAPFAACAGAYVLTEASSDPRLSHVGASFPAFLNTYAPAGDMLWMADVAKLERLWLESLFAADAGTLDGAGLLALGVDDGTRLVFHPATRFSRFSSPVVSIWRAHNLGDASALEAIDWRSESAIVTRRGLTVEVAMLEPAGLAFVRSIAAARTVVAAAEAALAIDPDLDLAALFAGLIEAGAFTSITFDGSYS